MLLLDEFSLWRQHLDMALFPLAAFSVNIYPDDHKVEVKDDILKDCRTLQACKVGG